MTLLRAWVAARADVKQEMARSAWRRVKPENRASFALLASLPESREPVYSDSTVAEEDSAPSRLKTSSRRIRRRPLNMK